VKVSLEEVVYFSGAEDLMLKLQELDPDFRRAAQVTDIEWEEEVTFAHGFTRHHRMTLVARVDASL
jgi:hypothetical protein